MSGLDLMKTIKKISKVRLIIQIQFNIQDAELKNLAKEEFIKTVFEIENKYP